MEEKKHCKWYNDEFCTNDKSPCVADYCPVVEYPELCKCRELDNVENLANVANNLANEEVIRGIENWILHDCTAKPQDLTNALDFIYRLQSENERLKKHIKAKEIADEHVRKMRSTDLRTIAEQKAEIERLNGCVMSEEQVRKCCADIIQETIAQANKDTAKECYEVFKFYKQNYYDIPLDLVARDIEEKTGVEVE